jgi:hypothetical protein
MTYEEKILKRHSTPGLKRNNLEPVPVEPLPPKKPIKPMKGAHMNQFSDELRDLIDKWRDQPGYALEELVDALEQAAQELVEEVNARV